MIRIVDAAQVPFLEYFLLFIVIELITTVVIWKTFPGFMPLGFQNLIIPVKVSYFL